jgi:hydroxymethylpyrimidine/phosphomethylpyrimidine kinase
MGHLVPDRFFWAQTSPEADDDTISPVSLQ